MKMTDRQYRALLDFMMEAKGAIIPADLVVFADSVAVKRGFGTWIIAYHEFNPL